MIFYIRLIFSRNPVGQEEKTQLCGVSSCYSYSTASAADGIPLPCGAGVRELRQCTRGRGLCSRMCGGLIGIVPTAHNLTGTNS